jgi:hypothetical protein
VEKCEVCGAPVHRVFHPVAVHFKGSGFYNTDYGKQKRAGGSTDGVASNNNSGDGAKPDSPKKSEKPAEKTTPAASSSSD